VGDCLVSARVLDLATGELGDRKAEELELAYRRSNLGPEHVVVDARFWLEPEDDKTVRMHMERYRKHRAETQPGAVQNAGSVFKNPPGDSAGRLVEAAGLKGFRVGGARVSELHANFFIASDGATAQQVYDLVTEVRERVRLTFGIELEPEIRFVGEFDDPVRLGEGSR
jgi:UDP-N-acetylmuramate dehydrogenase